MLDVQDWTARALNEHLHRVADQLGAKYSDRADDDEVEHAVFDEAAKFADARVTHYIPVLVEHAVEERLRRRPPGALLRSCRAGRE